MNKNKILLASGLVTVCSLLSVIHFLSVKTDPSVPLEPVNSERLEAQNSAQVLTKHSAKQINDISRLEGYQMQVENLPAPKSLAGTDHGVALVVDAQGNLVIGPEIQQLIEYYLSAIGEEPLENLLGRIQLALDEQLPQPALGQAQEILQRYVDYKIALSDVEADASYEAIPIDQQDQNLAQIRHRKEQRSALRQQYFNTEEYDRFFKEEEVYDQFMLDQLEIVQNADLDDSEKQLQIKQKEMLLPASIRETRQRVTMHADIYESVEKMRETGATEHAIYEFRSNKLGNEAADALAALDKKRQRWQQRLDRYVAARNQMNIAGLSPEDQNSALDQLIRNHFSGTEVIRVKALNSSL